MSGLPVAVSVVRAPSPPLTRRLAAWHANPCPRATQWMSPAPVLALGGPPCLACAVTRFPRRAAPPRPRAAPWAGLTPWS